MSIELKSPAGLHHTPGYNHYATIEPGSRLLWISGEVGLDADNQVVSPGLAGQARQAFENIGVALRDAGASWKDAFKLTIYVTDSDDLDGFRAVRDEFVDTAASPTSTLLKVSGLAIAGLLIEIEAVAAVAL
jgi:enamine deaminase RidA (YjgF/YER057c/UK114 family)